MVGAERAIEERDVQFFDKGSESAMSTTKDLFFFAKL
jgi:hypothetical protein